MSTWPELKEKLLAYGSRNVGRIESADNGDGTYTHTWTPTDEEPLLGLHNQCYFGVFNADCEEPTDPVYERRLIRFDPDTGKNTNRVSFPWATQKWGGVLSAGFFTEKEGGEPMEVGWLDAPCKVTKNDELLFCAGTVWWRKAIRRAEA